MNTERVFGSFQKHRLILYPVSDAAGFLHIEQVRNGAATLTIKANGFADYVTLITLVSGHDNHFDITM